MDIISIIDNLRYMANGYNPITREKCSERDTLCNEDVQEMLHKILVYLRSQKTHTVIKFRNVAVLSHENQTLTRIAEHLTDYTNYTTNELLKMIRDYLIKIGYLKFRMLNGKLRSYATKLGEENGLRNIKSNPDKVIKYNVVEYTLSAQKFIISRIEDIIENYNDNHLF